jgi:magnesium-transporting ATPase (P-type)
MSLYTCEIDLVQKDGQLKVVNSAILLPGDVVVIPQGSALPCDLILLTGSVIVNEAMLTGESIPVMKTCLPMTTEIYSETETTRHTLFGGTSVMQTRPVGNEPVLGLVRSTGFLTSKGALVRDILYPKILKFAFYSDSLKFVGIMALIAFTGFLVTLPSMLSDPTLTTVYIIDKSLNLVTITIPPALPAAMTCGTLFAIVRLKKLNIFCISPLRINVAGRIKTFVFDKTGTLTEEGLSVLGFRTVWAKK